MVVGSVHIFFTYINEMVICNRYEFYISHTQRTLISIIYVNVCDNLCDKFVVVSCKWFRKNKTYLVIEPTKQSIPALMYYNPL